jgi:hypothetical protein
VQPILHQSASKTGIKRYSTAFKDSINCKESNALTENTNGKLPEYITVSNGLSNYERFRIRVPYSLNKPITANPKRNKRKGRKHGKYDKSTIDQKIHDGSKCDPNK